jgi:hypothetical protein
MKAFFKQPTQLKFEHIHVFLVVMAIQYIIIERYDQIYPE